jgi:hypothetical protein
MQNVGEHYISANTPFAIFKPRVHVFGEGLEAHIVLPVGSESEMKTWM